MNFSFHPDADAEFFQAIEYYEECEAGLGCDFSVEVYSAIENIIDYPKAWPAPPQSTQLRETQAIE